MFGYPTSSIQQNSYTSPTPPKQEELWQNWQIDLATLSTNSMHQIVDGADHASFWLDAETAKVSIAAILQVVDAARTGQPLAQN